MGRKGSEHIQNLKAAVTQYTHQHAKQMTNMDHVKEFAFKTSIITIHEVVTILGISCGSVQTTLK
jgi:hypothetical protein